jgi:hypothetical protein
VGVGLQIVGRVGRRAHPGRPKIAAFDALLYIEGKRAVNDLRFIKKLNIMMCLRDIGRFMVNAHPEDDCNPFGGADDY